MTRPFEYIFCFFPWDLAIQHYNKNCNGKNKLLKTSVKPK